MINNSTIFNDVHFYFFVCLVPIFLTLALYARIYVESFSKSSKNRLALFIIFMLSAIISFGLANLFIPSGFQ
ncbi:hypothetical protein F971_03142 [Acinetobacter vivianii]|uniref:Uncharacterized protein n=1 Tax=Acinetobacter vivianii TaxID=1776742 RepID=N8WAV0_9GAMM|nr:hypothetical protein F971_03142 [Acinetobacter vivianii]